MLRYEGFLDLMKTLGLAERAMVEVRNLGEEEAYDEPGDRRFELALLDAEQAYGAALAKIRSSLEMIRSSQ